MAYSPPKGIPNPSASFGWEIDRATPSWPDSWLTGTTSPTAGYYYVDKTAPGATNTANTYGHPQLPRLTPPEGNLVAGAFIYIHAGTYTSGDSGGDRWDWSGTGTSGSPIWITGNPAAKPTFSDLIHVGEGASASYFVIENLFVTGARGITLRPTVNGDDIDHVLIRNCGLTGASDAGDTSGIEIGLSSSSDTIPLSTISYVVVYNCEISNYGNKSTSDQAGVYNGMHTDYVWVLDCLIHDVGADAVAGSHYANYTTTTSEHYFIGRNTIYGNGENGIDLKVIRYFVISENEIYGPFTREQGWGIVLHYGADTNFYCRDGAVIFNRLHHLSGGIYTGTSAGCDNLDIVGNLIYDIHAIYAVDVDALNGSAIQLGGSHGKFRFVDNTFFDCDKGVDVRSLTTGDAVELHGNIHSDITGYSLITVNGQEGFVTLNYGLYEGTPTFFWANASRTLAYMQGTALQEANAVSGDPLFIDSGSGNFGLDTGSPAIGASVQGPVGDSVYTAFQTMFGESILFDFDGVSRPASGAWDMGALEYVADVYALNITTLNATTLTVG